MKRNRLRVLGITSVALLSASVVWAEEMPQSVDMSRLQQQMQTMNELHAANHQGSEPGDDAVSQPGMVQDQPQNREQAKQRLNKLTDDDGFLRRSRDMRFGVGYESRMGAGQFPGFGDSGGFPAAVGTIRGSGGSAGGSGGGAKAR